jgi:hypothetical protein
MTTKAWMNGWSYRYGARCSGLELLRNQTMSPPTNPEIFQNWFFLQMYSQTMSVIEVAIPLKTATLFDTLSVTEITSPLLTRLHTFTKSISVTELSSPILTKLQFLYKTLSVTEVTTPLLSASSVFVRSVSVTATGIATLIAKLLPKPLKEVIFFLSWITTSLGLTSMAIKEVQDTSDVTLSAYNNSTVTIPIAGTSKKLDESSEVTVEIYKDSKTTIDSIEDSEVIDG